MYKTLFNNLWKATTAYVVGSFALIQFASVSFTYFDLETSLGLTNTEIMKLLYVVLAIGFPSTLALVFFFKKDVIDKDEVNSNNSLLDNKKIGAYKQKIAVIPFTNLNKDDDGSFLVDGIVEDLITEFSMI